MKIVFMGTPDFAVPSLEILLKNAYEVVGVVTAPDRPAGRGMKLQHSAVKQFALQHNLHVMQPEKLKSADFKKELESLNADLYIVVAFRMLPESIWSMPSMGCFNLHGSLLPQYRGAAPLNWAIINGEKTTGLTTFFLKHEIDTGSILFQEKIEITESMNVGNLHDMAMQKGADLVLKTVKAIESKSITPISQEEIMQHHGLIEEQLRHAPKIFKETTAINWNKNIQEIFNLVRGLSPYPTAHTMLQGQLFKIYEVNTVQEKTNTSIGITESDGKSFIRVAAADGWVYLLDLQMQGKKRMGVQEFLRGFKFNG